MIRIKSNMVSWLNEFNQMLVKSRNEAEVVFHGMRFTFTEESADPRRDDPNMFKRFVTITDVDEEYKGLEEHEEDADKK